MTYFKTQARVGNRWLYFSNGTTVVTVTGVTLRSTRFGEDEIASVRFSPSVILNSRYVSELDANEFIRHFRFTSEKLKYSVGDRVMLEDGSVHRVQDVEPASLCCYKVDYAGRQPFEVKDAPAMLPDLSGWDRQKTAPPPNVKRWAEYKAFKGGYTLTVHTDEAVAASDVQYFTAPGQRIGIIGIVCKTCNQETLIAKKSEDGATILDCLDCGVETVVPI